MPIQPMNFAGIEPRQHPFASALQNAFNTYGQGVKARYLPLTTQAKALSQLTYANLMGPQFIAKMLSNPDIAANFSEEQKRNAINTSYAAGTGLGANGIGSIISSIFSGEKQKETPTELPPYLKQNTQSLPMPPSPDMSKLDEGPEDLPRQILSGLVKPKTYAERAGEAAGIKEEGRKAGGIRATQIADMDDQYQQSLQAEVPINHIVDIINTSEFTNMRNKIPFYQKMQLQALAKIGTPEEQKYIGDFITSTTSAVANTINGFRGRILDKEFLLANQMKINPDDTWNVMIGKLESIKTFNEMTKQRSRIVSELMQNEHMNKGRALEKVDKMIDGKKIREQVEDSMSPKVTIRDKDTGDIQYNVPYSKAIRMMKENKGK